MVNKGDSVENISNILELYESGKVDKAKEKCKKFFDQPKFVSLYIKMLISEGELAEAEELSKKHMKSNQILSQYVYILILEKRYEEAKTVCEKYSYIENIQAQYIIVLEHFKEFDKIDEVAKRYPYNRFILKSHAICLSNQGRYSEALEICNRYLHDKGILEVKIDVEKKMKRRKIDPVYFEIIDLIKNNEYEKAKEKCVNKLDDNRFYELYIMILEKERILKNKKALKNK